MKKLLAMVLCLCMLCCAAAASAEGVVDFEGLTVGGGTANIAVGERECAVLGEVTITYG